MYKHRTAGTWDRLGGAGIELYGGPLGLVNKWPPNGDLVLWLAAAGPWKRLTPAFSIDASRVCAVSAQAIYMLPGARDAVYQYDPVAESMSRIGSAASKIYAARWGMVATDPNTGNVFRYLGSPNNWQQIGGAGATFAVADDSVYELTPDRSRVYRYDGTGQSWTRIGGTARELYGGDWGLLATATQR